MSSSEPKKDRFAPLTYEQMYGVEEPEPDGRPLELEIDSLVPFPNQPFNPYKEDEMAKMVESIQENGIISPIIVRPKEDGETYEIISGHNRVEACRRAGICKIPSFIREVDDDTAIILMVDSNLRQREKLKPSEKAKAYKMKMDAMRHQGARSDLTLSQVATKLGRTDSGSIIGENGGESRDQVYRYIRLGTDSSFMRSWEAFCNYLNVCAGGRNGAGPYLPHIQVLDRITAHMLRHTYATMLFDADVDVKSAQKFLGHADIEVTLKIYTHLTKFKEEKAIAALNAHLDSMTGNVSEKSGAS